MTHVYYPPHLAQYTLCKYMLNKLNPSPDAIHLGPISVHESVLPLSNEYDNLSTYETGIPFEDWDNYLFYSSV